MVCLRSWGRGHRMGSYGIGMGSAAGWLDGRLVGGNERRRFLWAFLFLCSGNGLRETIIRERLPRRGPQSRSHRENSCAKKQSVQSVHPSLGFLLIHSNGKFAEIDCVGTPSLIYAPVIPSYCTNFVRTGHQPYCNSTATSHTCER